MLYTMKEVAEKLRINVTFAHRLRKAGLLPCIKLGMYKVRKDSLEEFLKKYEGCDLSIPEEVVKEGDLDAIVSASD